MCRHRFDVLSSLEAELHSQQFAVQIVGIGGMQFQSTTADIDTAAAGANLPLVEETAQQPVWQAWGAQWRDLYILDRNGNLFAKLNLTNFDPDPSVQNGQNYAQLKSLFIQAEAMGISSAQFLVATLAVTQDAGNAVLTVARTGNIGQAATVMLTTSDGTAKANVDYVPVATVVTFAPGIGSRDVSIPLIPHASTNPTATFEVALSNANGMQVGDPAQVIVTIYAKGPTPNQRFLAVLYQELLHRDPEAAGLAAWSGLLDRGVSRSQVTLAIEQSLEYRQDEIQSLYAHYLKRQADPTGLAAFSNLLAQGGTLEQVTADIVGSPEYYQTRGGGTSNGFLTAVYEDILLRAIDATGRNSFGQALAAGVPRVQVAAAILASAEYRQDVIESDYLTFLNRQADASGLQFFTTALAQGTRAEVMVAEILGSDEFFSKL
jgi:hypothetical protein